ncbi:MAG: 5-guanidino-2-oxopentanoate decarboxylase [Streptosporangiales bacterium]
MDTTGTQHGPMTGGQALGAALAAHGVRTVFGIPGTHNLAVYRALDEYGIDHVLPRHEQGAGYAADGYARICGRPGVCLTTTGPAILNAATAAAQAYSDSVPVLFVSPGMPLSHPAHGNGTLHEVKDQSAAMGSVVAYSHRVTSVAEIPAAVATCFAAMTAGRPRPVHLEVPLDLLEAETPVELLHPVQASSPVPNEQLIAEAARRLERAERPLVVAGGGASGAASQVAALAERLGAPVLTSCNGKGVLREDHPLSLGAGPQHPSVQRLVEESDALLAVGTELAPADWWLGPPRVDGDLIRVDIDPIGAVANATPTLALVGDAARTLDGICSRINGRNRTDASRVAEWRKAIREESRAEGEPWIEIVEAIAAALPEEAVVTADNAMVSYYGALSNLPAFHPRSFLFPTGGGTLGYGLPAGIGAKVASPATPVLVLQGDGGTMFTVAELAAAAALGIALPVVVVDNGGYGEIRNEMENRGERAYAVSLGHPDFVALARALGCDGVRIESPAHLSEQIETALHADRPVLLHVAEKSRAADHLL